MNRYIKTLFVILLFLTILSTNVLAENPSIISIDKLQPGQKGIAKTVFAGTEIEEFPVEVVNIVKGQRIESNLILIKAFGDIIDKIGGIASGMSGSPVYIEGKLAGAISYKWENSEHKYALVTPIQEMLDLKKQGKDLSFYDELNTVQTPIMVAGLSGRSLDNLKDGLAIKDSRIISGLSASHHLNTNEDFKFKAGSAIAVQLIRGDVSVASIGTVTLVDKGYVYAFGHPFLNKGESNYLMSGAYIDAIIPSQSQPFKVGSPLDELLGIVQSDRNAGILGRIDQFPNIIPLTVEVKDNSLKTSRVVRTQIVNDEKMLRELGSSVILESIDSTLDRIGEGTSKVNIAVTGSNLPEGKIEKENMYYSNNDIAVATLIDYNRLMDLIVRNSFKEINIFDIKVNIEVDKTDDIALIEEAEILDKDIYPGDTLYLKLVLRPYRANAISRELSIEIPEDINIGMATLTLSAGYGNLLDSRDNQEEENDMNRAVIEGYKSFEELIEDYLEAPMNNEITLQVYPAFISQDQAGIEEKAEGSEVEDSNDVQEKETDTGDDQSEAAEPEEKPEIKKKIYTDYVLEGSLALDFEVKEKPDNEKETKTNLPKLSKE
ncbi:MAG: hypothetical protein KGY44_04545 [Halanaerobiales bacterium]|nr:hypothetical protein [Halanaerobiales bacterium]